LREDLKSLEKVAIGNYKECVKILCSRTTPPSLWLQYQGASNEQATFAGCDDPRMALLAVGKVYRMIDKEIHSWHTKVKLEGYDKLWFNSVCFKEVSPPVQPEVCECIHYPMKIVQEVKLGHWEEITPPFYPWCGRRR
jgi:hypothetical protein